MDKSKDKGYYDTLDQILNVAVYNLFSISKENNIIKLSNVRYDDNKHWALLNIVNSMSTIWGREVQLDMGVWDFFRLKRRIHNKSFKRVRENKGKECDKFIWDIEDAYPNILDPFEDIAKEYYPRKRVKHENLHRRRDK